MKMISIALTALTSSEKLSLSGEMLLRGLGTVFMVLIILLAVLVIFGKVFGGAEKKSEKTVSPVQASKNEAPAKKSKNEVSKPVAPAVNTPAVSAATESKQDDKELIAVITAAIAAYQSASGQPNLPFRVVSFTRKNNASGWMGNSADNQ